MNFYRRRQELGISDSVGRTITDDDELYQVYQIREHFPTLGHTVVWERLRSMDFQVTRARLRNAIGHIDPLNIAMQWTYVTIKPWFRLYKDNMYYLKHCRQFVWYIQLEVRVKWQI